MIKHLIAHILIAVPVALFAQETALTDTSNRLKEIVISYQAIKNTPVTFQNLYSKELKTRSTGQEPSFLLAETTPSVTAYADAGNTQGYSYYRMRGIDQTRINTTLDGMPLNEPEDQGAYFSNYPDLMNSVSKIQIQRGNGTSKNGVANYAGSIELFSPNLFDSARGSVGFNYGSFNSLRVFGEYNSGIKNRKAVYIRASQISSDGYKYNSSNNSQSVFLSTGLFLDRSIWKLNLLAGHQQNQLAWLGVADSLILKDRRTNANINEHDAFTQCLLQVHNKWTPTKSSSVQSSIYYTFLKGNYDFNLNGFLGLPTTAELYNYAFQSNLVGFFTNYAFSKNHLKMIAGVHGNVYNRRHIGSEKVLGELYKNTGYKKEAALFTKGDYTFGKLNFFADLQYRISSFDYRGSVPFEKISWSFFNPKAGVSYEVRSGTVIYYSIGRTGREPTRNDMFGGNDDLLPDSMGNAMISVKQPESVVNHELGLRYQSKQLNISLNGYYMDFNNEIVLNGKFGPNGLALTNKVEKSFRTGIELTINCNISNHVILNNNSSFNYSRIKEQKEKFSPILTPPLIINQELVYHQNNFIISLMARYQDKSFIDFANTATVKSYFLLNGHIAYNTKSLQLAVFINNITNSKYFNNGYVDFDGIKKYFVQAPANYSVSVKYNFR